MRSPRTDGRTVDRRRVLGAGAVALTGGLAGCIAAGAPDDCDPTDPPPNGFELRNGDPNEYTVGVEIIRDRLLSTPTVFEETYELGTGPGERVVRVDDAVRYTGRYVIRSWLESDPDVAMASSWSVSPDRCDSVRIRIDDGRLRISEPGNLGIL